MRRDHTALGETLPGSPDHDRRVRVSDVLDVDGEFEEVDVLVQVGDHLRLEGGEGEVGEGGRRRRRSRRGRR